MSARDRPSGQNGDMSRPSGGNGEFARGASAAAAKGAALIGLAVLLFAFTIVVNVAARWIANRTDRSGLAA